MAENESRTDYLSIFRTGKLWEFDLAREALKEQNIPFIAQTESLGGVRTALDAAPSMGPGVSWSLLVPNAAAEQAREVLRECRLDVEREPGVWDFTPPSKAKQSWRIFAWGMLLLIALLFLVEVILRNI